jgi:serine protease Do
MMKKQFHLFRGVLLPILLTLLLVAGCAPAQQEAAASPASTPADGETILLAEEGPAQSLPSIADVVARVKPSVVAISTEIVGYDIFNRAVTQEAEGSGWIVSEDGLVVTNNHVVEGARTVTVTLDDGSTYEAEDVYTDPLTDLALIRIPANGLPVVAIGDSSALQVGDTVVAIGNSLGMGISATAGIASAIGVSLEESPGQTLVDLIQTDAAINPGNSGGPLVNMAGQVIGINSIKIATVGVEGMGYAISINEALPIIQDLADSGRVIRPWMGIGVYTVNAAIAQRYGLAVDTGVLVTGVVNGSPAAQAQLKAGDVIVSLGGADTSDAQSFTDAILSHEIGETVEVVYWRGDSKETTTVTLGETPE